MHALAVRVSLSDAESALKTLKERVVPAVSQSPGFVAGYWTWSDDKSNGQSMIVFDSEEAAQTAAERIRGLAVEGATVEGIEVRQVVASA